MNRLFCLLIIGGAVSLSGCTASSTTAGQVSMFEDGEITGATMIDMRTRKYDSFRNSVLCSIGGAIIGNLIGGHTGSTVAGAGLGFLAGNAGTELANRSSDGLRLEVMTENGSYMLDEPFSCDLKPGTRIRVIQGGEGADVQVWRDGAFRTPTDTGESDCPSYYKKVRTGMTGTSSHRKPHSADYDD